jgi:hypothetical protein
LSIFPTKILLATELPEKINCVGRGGKSLRPRRNGQVRTNEPRKLEEIIMHTATLEGLAAYSKSRRNEPGEGAERNRETL